MRDSPTREYFARVDEAARSLRLAEWALEHGPARAGGARAGGLADPVYARALYDEAALARMEAAGRELALARRRIAWLRSIYSRKADVLELRHCRLMRWDEVAGELGVAPSTARAWHGELCDWVDSFGWGRARDGRGTAEG